MAEPQSHAGFGMIGLAMRVLHPSQGRMTAYALYHLPSRWRQDTQLAASTLAHSPALYPSIFSTCSGHALTPTPCLCRCTVYTHSHHVTADTCSPSPHAASRSARGMHSHMVSATLDTTAFSDGWYTAYLRRMLQKYNEGRRAA